MITENTCFKAVIDSKDMLALPKGGHRSTWTGPDHDNGVGVRIHSSYCGGRWVSECLVSY
jgi:hypothetical protein